MYLNSICSPSQVPRKASTSAAQVLDWEVTRVCCELVRLSLLRLQEREQGCYFFFKGLQSLWARDGSIILARPEARFSEELRILFAYHYNNAELFECRRDVKKPKAALNRTAEAGVTAPRRSPKAIHSARSSIGVDLGLIADDCPLQCSVFEVPGLCVVRSGWGWRVENPQGLQT